MLKIIFESKNFIVLDKPSGTLSVPSRMGKSDPRPCLGIELQNHLRFPVYPIHRLDFEVSGLIVFAKNTDAQRELSIAFENHLVQKTYEAWTEGDPTKLPSHTEKWHSLLVKGKKRAFEAPHGKPATTMAIPLHPKKNFLHWNLKPLTGRSHQLRYELSKRGFPIIGDTLYGAKTAAIPNEIALRAIKLELPEGICPELPRQLDTSPLRAPNSD